MWTFEYPGPGVSHRPRHLLVWRHMAMVGVIHEERVLFSRNIQAISRTQPRSRSLYHFSYTLISYVLNVAGDQATDIIPDGIGHGHLQIVLVVWENGGMYHL